MEITNVQNVASKIKGYNLMDTLHARLNIVVKDGVAKTTIYKAFRVGPSTDLLRQVLETALDVLSEHEASVKEKIMAIA